MLCWFKWVVGHYYERNWGNVYSGNLEESWISLKGLNYVNIVESTCKPFAKANKIKMNPWP